MGNHTKATVWKLISGLLVLVAFALTADSKTESKLESWQKSIDTLIQAENKFFALIADAAAAEKTRQELGKKINLFTLENIIKNATQHGTFQGGEEADGDAIVVQLKKVTARMTQMETSGLLMFAVNPTEGVRILPTTPLILEEPVDEIKMIAAQGEFEPASFAVFSSKDLENVTLKTTDLVNADGATIPASAIDIKVVKCWYQTGSNWNDASFWEGTRILVPELLLHDDALVKVDLQAKENYVRLTTAEKSEYHWISDPSENPRNAGGHLGGNDVLSVTEFPVQDSPELLPLRIPAMTGKQFWLTIKVPSDAPVGIYSSKIRISDGAKELAEMKLKLRVLPFALPEPKAYYDINREFTSSIYYLSQLCSCCPAGTISAGHKSEEQLEAELKNMADHGVTNPLFYECKENLITNYLELRRKAGMSNRTLYDLSFYFPGRIDADFIGLTRGVPIPQDKLDQLKQDVVATLAVFRACGVEELYLYGQDEAVDEGVTAQLPGWRAIQEAGGKVFASGYYRAGLWHNKKAQFDLAGDDLDLFISANETTREEAAKWHAKGHRIWSYANPQAGSENPALYRQNFGFSLWKANYDGAATWVYIHSSGWNDFNAPGKDYNFVYPTGNGVIDTIAWEGYREAIDDIRYGTLLKELIATGMNDPARVEVAREADAYLETVDLKKSPDQIRLEIIHYILKLQ